MTILTLPALVVALTTPGQLAPVTVAPATPAHYRPYNPPPRYRPYTTSPSYRSYRRSRSYRKSHYANDYLKKGGGTFTFRGGYHDFTGETGLFRALQPWGSFGYGLGWNLSPFVHLGVGVDGLFFGQKDHQLGRVKSIGQVDVITDLTFRLIRPSERRYLVPFLQVGVGLALLTASKKTTTTTTNCDGTTETAEGSKSITLARGGLFQVGGGLEIFLSHFVSLSVRALYRAQPMSGMRCLEGAACDPDATPSQTNLHGILADASLTIHFNWF